MKFKFLCFIVVELVFIVAELRFIVVVHLSLKKIKKKLNIGI